MAGLLVKDVFTPDDIDEVQSFDCGDQPYAREVSDWLKGPLGADSALSSIQHPNNRSRVWLYRREEDDALVGFGALGTSQWRWTKKKDPIIPLTVIIWVTVQMAYQGKSDGADRNLRYASQILDDLIAEALETQETHPILELFVHQDNAAAIAFYRRKGSTVELDATKDPNYKRIARILNPQRVVEIIEASKK